MVGLIFLDGELTDINLTQHPKGKPWKAETPNKHLGDTLGDSDIKYRWA